MAEPLVSVLMPLYNVKHTIEVAIASLLSGIRSYLRTGDRNSRTRRRVYAVTTEIVRGIK